MEKRNIYSHEISQKEFFVKSTFECIELYSRKKAPFLNVSFLQVLEGSTKNHANSVSENEAKSDPKLRQKVEVSLTKLHDL